MPRGSRGNIRASRRSTAPPAREGPLHHVPHHEVRAQRTIARTDGAEGRGPVLRARVAARGRTPGPIPATPSRADLIRGGSSIRGEQQEA
ncbi:hypothetical protein GCM10010400_55740 [Streptomyces aculeolatus]